MTAIEESESAHRVALVTGSSRGLGAAIAHELARAGFAVAVNGIDEDETREVAASIRDTGAAAEAFVVDVTDPAATAEIGTSVESKLGPIDVLVLNATGPQPHGSILDVGWSEHLAELDFFVKSPVLLGAALIPSMIERGFGRIINIDSEVAHFPPPGRSAYATAKSAQIGLTRAWARELAPSGITVNTIAPGFVPVERHAGLEDVQADYAATVPVGRIGVPNDIANAVLFFASDAASFVTGQRLVVDGGRSLAD